MCTNILLLCNNKHGDGHGLVLLTFTRITNLFLGKYVHRLSFVLHDEFSGGSELTNDDKGYFKMNKCAIFIDKANRQILFY